MVVRRTILQCSSHLVDVQVVEMRGTPHDFIICTFLPTLIRPIRSESRKISMTKRARNLGGNFAFDLVQVEFVGERKSKVVRSIFCAHHRHFAQTALAQALNELTASMSDELTVCDRVRSSAMPH